MDDAGPPDATHTVATMTMTEELADFGTDV
jgi:hypothetical protein